MACAPLFAQALYKRLIQFTPKQSGLTMLSTPELIIIFLIIMLVYGGTRLPAMGRGLGQGVREFREGLRGDATNKDRTASHDAQNGTGGTSDSVKNTQV